MAERNHSRRTVALVGGAALVAWFLFRGNGSGFRGPGDGKGKATGATRRPARCKVWVRADRIEIDGVVADLPTVIAKCRAAGQAEVRATGDAVTRAVLEVLTALHAAGVTIYASPDLARMVPAEVLP